MPVELISFGEPYQDNNPDLLVTESARQALFACIKHNSFEVVELRKWTPNGGGVADVVVVDCINDQVPSRNDIGIKVREPLALVFHQGKTPEVRSLRKGFPNVLHLNPVHPTEPVSFCLYFQTWSAVERSWTPQKHLQRILWWLAETAKNSLHSEDQPLENIYFDSPFEIVLPPDYEVTILNRDQVLTFSAIKTSGDDFQVIRGKFVRKEDASDLNLSKIELLDIELPAVVHGTVDMIPNTLGKLNEHYSSRGVPFFERLVAIVNEKAKVGLVQDSTQRCLLIIRVPLLRNEGATPEKIEVKAFLTTLDLVGLGIKTGSLFRAPTDGRYYTVCNLGQREELVNDEWVQQEILPIELSNEVDRALARKYSGVSDDASNIKCTLMGVGALGGSMAELASKSGWGTWTFIDPDIVKAHNIMRHISKNCHIGHFKAEVVKKIVERNYQDGHYVADALNDSATNFSNEKVMTALNSSSLIIDATTTLEVPREISQVDEVSRSVSVFITPSGRDAVLLFEDDSRNIRLDALEPQYYRAIIDSEWGSQHLAGNQGSFSVGAGCRDMTAVISYESIQLAAAILTKQVRLHQSIPDPRITVWTGSDVDSSFIAQEVPVSSTIKEKSDGWTVVFDQHIKKQLKEMRLDHLPKETGGIIIGYIDQKLKTIYVVDVLPAPYDSKADYSGFTRGIAGLDDALTEIAKRTANIVGYVGEWHSHPKSSSAKPSSLDWTLIEKLSDVLAIEGMPALMMIVGVDTELSVTVRYQT